MRYMRLIKPIIKNYGYDQAIQYIIELTYDQYLNNNNYLKDRINIYKSIGKLLNEEQFCILFDLDFTYSWSIDNLSKYCIKNDSKNNIKILNKIYSHCYKHLPLGHFSLIIERDKRDLLLHIIKIGIRNDGVLIRHCIKNYCFWGFKILFDFYRSNAKTIKDLEVFIGFSEADAVGQEIEIINNIRNYMYKNKK